MRYMIEKRQQSFVASIFLVLPLAITATLVLTGWSGYPASDDDGVAYAVDNSSAEEPSNFTKKSDQDTLQPLGPLPPAPDDSTSEDSESESATPIPAAPAPDAPAGEPTANAPRAEPGPRAPEAGPAFTAPSSPPKLQTPEARGNQALGQINYPWAEFLPGWSVSFHDERKGVYGYTLVNERRIEVYVRPDQSEEFLAHVIAHEIGHAVDVTLNSPSERTEWQQARGIQGAPWWPGDGASDFATGAGDFAESFAAWQVGPTSFRSKLAPAPDAAQVGVLEKLAVG